MRMNALFCLILAVSPVFVAAQSIEEAATVELLPGWRDGDGHHTAALRITLAPGWVTYWRAPGDGGIPPYFVFSANSGVGAVTPHWPVPEVFDYAGLISIGYRDTVVLPLQIDLDADDGTVVFDGEVTIGVCREVCIPVTYQFETLLPATTGSDGVILDAMADNPMSAAQAGVGSVSCRIAPISDGLTLEAELPMPQMASDEYVVVETGDPTVWVSQSDVIRDGDVLRATVDMVGPSGQPFAVDRSQIRFTVLANGTAVDITGCTAG